MTDTILALDVGTTSLRAIVFSLDGNILGQGRSRITSLYPKLGHVEQDAELLWHNMIDVIQCALKCAKKDKQEIAAIGITAQRSSIVVWDAETGCALSPMVIWSDTRAVGGVDWLAKGYLVVPQMAAAKLPLVIEKIIGSNTQTKQKNLRWGNIDSYLTWKLTNGVSHITDRSQAATTGYLNPATLDWNDALIEEQGLDRELFPKIVDSWDDLTVTSKQAFGARIPITAIIADQQSAMMAHGAVTPGKCKVSYGTSGSFNINTGGNMIMVAPTLPPWVQYTKAGTTNYCIEGMVMSVGSMFDWLMTINIIDNIEECQLMAEQVSDSAGVFVLPSIHGVGAPYGKPEQKGMIGGLTSGSTKAHIIRATMEGIAFRIREVTDFVYNSTSLARLSQVPADGGASRNDLFMQIQADILNLPVARHITCEATALGAAISAGLGANLFELNDISRFAKYDRIFEPQISADEAESRLCNWQALVSNSTINH